MSTFLEERIGIIKKRNNKVETNKDKNKIKNLTKNNNLIRIKAVVYW